VDRSRGGPDKFIKNTHFKLKINLILPVYYIIIIVMKIIIYMPSEKLLKITIAYNK
jgi:hypothetical protein